MSDRDKVVGEEAISRQGRRWWRIAGLLVGISALPGLLVACARRSQETDSQRAIGSTSAALAAPSPLPAPEPIVVSIDAVPLSATIFVDGVALETNPYEAERPRDARSHMVRIEAPGYQPQSSSVAFSGPVHMHVELVPLRGSGQPAAQRPPAARPPATPSASAAR